MPDISVIFKNQEHSLLSTRVMKRTKLIICNVLLV